jgi:DMSO/TMAO reductase YedYZ molybdopterin-dependent catalytic subunit
MKVSKAMTSLIPERRKKMKASIDKTLSVFKTSILNRRQFTVLFVSSTAAFFLGGLRAIAYGYQKVRAFRIRSIEGTQSVDLKTWKLKVDGLVERPMEFTYQDILQLPGITQVKNFVCVEGWGLDNQKWEGFHLSEIFDRVKVKPEAKYVTFRATGGKYSDSLSVEEALEPETLLAYRLNDKPLPPEQGNPIRLVVPRMYGYKSVKWVERITLEETQHMGYWERSGYPVDGSME